MSKNYSGSLSDTVADETSALGAKLSDSATQFKNTVSELGRQAADAIDENMDSAACGLNRAAAELRRGAHKLPGVDKVSGLTNAVADKLSATAGYVRERNIDKIMADVKAMVRKNPGSALVAAGVVCFLVGRAFRRGDIS